MLSAAEVFWLDAAIHEFNGRFAFIGDEKCDGPRVISGIIERMGHDRNSEEEFRLLRNIAIGMFDAMARNGPVRVPPEVLACLLEWAETGSVQDELPSVREIMEKLNRNIGNIDASSRPRNRAERRKHG